MTPDPHRPVVITCAECGRTFTDLEEYQRHVHPDPQAPVRGCLVALVLAVIAWVFILYALRAIIDAATGPGF